MLFFNIKITTSSMIKLSLSNRINYQRFFKTQVANLVQNKLIDLVFIFHQVIILFVLEFFDSLK